ncbi:MAG: hypothetical protein K6G11_01365 [Lachnospiraceae bacterium]|nr:hypothetical protein [Lachnospiraceae bacterium]
MVIWNKKFYTDEKVGKKLKKYLKMVKNYNKKKVPLNSFYLITFPSNGDNCLDIYSAGQFWLDYKLDQADLEIVGMAASRDTCMELLADIMNDILEAYGDISAKAVTAFFSEE